MEWFQFIGGIAIGGFMGYMYWWQEKQMRKMSDKALEISERDIHFWKSMFENTKKELFKLQKPQSSKAPRLKRKIK